MTRHRDRSRRSSWRLPVALATVALAVLAWGVAGRFTPERDAPSRPGPQQSEGAPIVVPVVPVGGDTPAGRVTEAEALAAVDAAAQAGAVGVRMTADMRWLCPTPTCTTAPLDPLVARAQQRDLRVYIHVNSTPAWMDDRGRWYAPTGDDAVTWAGLFAQLVEHFGTTVAGYEVWNEPNNEEFWAQGPDPGEYADLLKAVWTASKAVSPDAQLIGAVLSNNDLGYMRALDAALVERGGNRENSYFYDQLGVHPYAGGRDTGYEPGLPPGSRSVQVATGEKDMTFLGVERLRAQVAEDEGIWRRVVIGEFGYDTTPGNWYYVPEPTRSEYLEDALHIAAGWDWLDGFTVYGDGPYLDDGWSLVGTPSEAVLRNYVARNG